MRQYLTFKGGSPMAALQENLGVVILSLVFIGFCLWGGRQWKILHPQRRLAVVVGVSAGIMAILVALLNPPWAGRWLMVIVFSGLLAYGALYYAGRQHHAKTLDSFAAETGMVSVKTSEEERSAAELIDLRKWLEPDLYKWKVAGQYPALIQKRGEWTCVIRTPFAVDFELNAPDYTCFSYVRKIPLNTLTIQEYRQQKTKPQKIFKTEDPDFDARFCLTGVNKQDALAIFVEPVRKYFLKMPILRGWIRLERFGIYYYMPGSVTSREQIDKGLELLDLLAKRIEDAVKEGALTEPF